MACGSNMRVCELDDHFGVVMEVFKANRDATLSEIYVAIAQQSISQCVYETQ
jgi:hypothetical protein